MSLFEVCNIINGIESFWSYANIAWYNLTGYRSIPLSPYFIEAVVG